MTPIKQSQDITPQPRPKTEKELAQIQLEATLGTKQSHTNTPWSISHKCSDSIICIGEPDNTPDYYGGKLICESVEPSNAKHIVKCVNSHDALVEALKEISQCKRTETLPVKTVIKMMEALLLAESER